MFTYVNYLYFIPQIRSLPTGGLFCQSGSVVTRSGGWTQNNRGRPATHPRGETGSTKIRKTRKTTNHASTTQKEKRRKRIKSKIFIYHCYSMKRMGYNWATNWFESPLNYSFLFSSRKKWNNRYWINFKVIHPVTAQRWESGIVASPRPTEKSRRPSGAKLQPSPAGSSPNSLNLSWVNPLK